MTEDTTRTLNDRVHDLAAEAGAVSKANVFDGGRMFTITMPGRGSVACSYEWGDDEDQIITILRAKMSAAGMLTTKHEFVLDYGNGNVATIWAADAQQAVRLASRGTPETITDLTTGESKAWVDAG